ncbi:MAG TPA: hypothetical protein VFN49_10325 [Candidatus Aquilonibacter sp.]|nr:hypothetical protein [Candidatus Aquilonibacter sp.]
MKTPSETTTNVAQEEQQPVNSFTRMIEVAPSGASFGGWGPKVIGLTSSLTRWN